MDASGFPSEQRLAQDEKAEPPQWLQHILLVVLGPAAVAFVLWYLHRFYASLTGVPHV